MCDLCPNKSRSILCPCGEVGYCSDQCAQEAWISFHADACSYDSDDNQELEPNDARVQHLDVESTPTSTTAPVEARQSETLESLFKLLQNANASETDFLRKFNAAYPQSAYAYTRLNYDRCNKPVLKLDSRGDVAITMFSSIQRLWRDYFGPWTGARVAVLKLPPGFGKTAMGHLLFANYKHEAVLVPDIANNSGDLVEQPRIPIWITRPTLAHQVSEDLWAQDDRNPAEIKQKIRDNGGLVAEQSTQFNRTDLVMSYAQFENLLQGRNAAGRRLWAGRRITDKGTVISAMETYTGVPTAYRLVDGRWVRGNAPHSLDTTTDLRNLELTFARTITKDDLEKIKRIVENNFEATVRQWQNYRWLDDGGRKLKLPVTLRKAIKNLAAVEIRGNRTLRIIIRWKSREVERLPSAELWTRWVRDGFLPFTAYNNLQKIYSGDIDARALFQDPTDSVSSGWRLDQTTRGATVAKPGRPVLSWVQTDEPEIDYNPLDRCMLIIDEAHNIADSSLVSAALRDSKNVVVVNMSASIDLYTGLPLLNNGLPKRENTDPRALGPAYNLPDELPVLTESIRTYTEMAKTLTPLYFDVERNDFTDKFLALSDVFKGMISVAKISEMRDVFAEAVYPEDQIIKVPLSDLHASRVSNLINASLTAGEELAEAAAPKRTTMRKLVKSIHQAIAVYPERLIDRFNLSSKAYRDNTDTVAGELIYGVGDESAVFPAAEEVLRKLHALDVKEMAEKNGNVTKRMIVSSTADHDYGVIPMATALQAAGYEWVSIEPQQLDLSKLSEVKLRNLRKDRRLGVKIAPELRKVKLVPEPMTKHSSGVDEDLRPAHSRKQFAVLSEALINSVLVSANLEPTLASLKKDVLFEDRPNLKTVYKFHPSKDALTSQPADSREEFVPFRSDDKARRETTDDLRRVLQGKRVYLWPGYREDMDNWSMFRETGPMSVLLDNRESQPFFFVRTQRTLIKLGVDIEELNITRDEERQNYTWPREDFNPTRDFLTFMHWLRPATELGEDIKKDAQDTILEAFNSLDNLFGENIRFLLLGEGFLEGINVKAVTKVVELEPSVTHGNALQRRGRAIRRCGHEGLPFAEWRVEFYTVVHTVPRDDLLIDASLFGDEGEDWPSTFEEPDIASESAETKKQRERVEKEQRRFAYRQLSSVRELGPDPIDWTTVPLKGRFDRRTESRIGATPVLDSETKLQLYEALRVLHEDPRITVVRLRGEQILDEWATDRRHNKLRVTNTGAVRLDTNYILRSEGIGELITKVNEKLASINNKESTKARKLSTRRNYLLSVLEFVEKGGGKPVLYREFGEKNEEKELYLFMRKTTMELQTKQFSRRSPTNLLAWLVRHRYAIWGRAVDPAGASETTTDSAQDEQTEAEDVLVGSSLEELGMPDEEQEAIELENMSNVYRILATLGLHWNPSTTRLLWPTAQENDGVRSSKLNKRESASTKQLQYDEASLLGELFADSGSSDRKTPVKRLVKRAILDIYRYGVMNWYRAAALLAHVLRVQPSDSYWATGVNTPRTERTLTEGQLKKAAIFAGALFRLASASKLNTYLDELREFGLGNIESLDAKVTLVLASARWFDDIVIKRRAKEITTRQGALGFELDKLSAILKQIREIGINIPRHIDALLKPLARDPKATPPFPTSLEELEQQITRQTPRPQLTTLSGDNANRLFTFYVKYKGLAAAREELSTELAKRNTIARAFDLPLDMENSDESTVDQQVGLAVSVNLDSLKQSWPAAVEYTAEIITNALLKAFKLKEHWIRGASMPENADELNRRLSVFREAATERLSVKTTDMRRFLEQQETQKRADELETLQNRPTRLTGFVTAQRVVNKATGVAIERTERKDATDVIPVGESVAVEELVEPQQDEPDLRLGTLVVRIDERIAIEKKIPGGLLQTLADEQRSITNLAEMYVTQLVLYNGTKPLDDEFVERLFQTTKFLSNASERVQRFVNELAKKNMPLLRDLLINRAPASLLKLITFAAVPDTINGFAILEQHHRLTDAFIDEFEDAPASDFQTRLGRFCSSCQLDDFKHLILDPLTEPHYPYETQREWDARTGYQQPDKVTSKIRMSERAAVLRQNDNMLRIAVILYNQHYGSYREHVDALRRYVADLPVIEVHKRIPRQTMVTNQAARGKSVNVVSFAFKDAVESRLDNFLGAY